ncbi:MAG: hypothetical protein A3F84_21245 [Candidatus Handelsmanbacteria bacterium RIFCSPLOWO2_12_FULL_64_10]|uniref:non-specific serine/threonine protein kinase n=1 Tax=Handelsmanbacteria sp. (strain RIFCSPLOWO2_12_FULL_64_10) TaxID=1817868 RepID=A0A1F6D4B0_HANXR|nr:MAG: hypothetical protein A3F84_21245 [Candidatus Handelsmanbacteria bacterium RIFCSPLOWO2_12_FULL_64_10]
MADGPIVDLALQRGLLSPAQVESARGLSPDEWVARGLVDRREMDLLLRLSGRPRLIAGRYEVLEEIGRGGMGVVFKCRDRRLDRVVAVKGLPDWLGSEPDRFEREARTAARLRHPNIVAVHDFGRDGDGLFLTMDYIAGRSFGQLIEASALDRRQCVAIVHQIAGALDAARRQAVVHRDVKPENILIDSRGRAYLTDFGLARRITDASTTATGLIMGTPAYMSPEQARGGQVDHRSDVYNLGATLYHALTGRIPFTGENPMAMVLSVLEGGPPAPRAVQPNVAPDLETITLKAMDREPDRRYQTAGDLAEDLRRFLGGEPILARPPTWRVRLVRSLRRYKAPAAVAVLGLCFAGAALVQSILAARDRDAQILKAEADRVALLRLTAYWNQVLLAKQGIYQRAATP